MKQIYFLAAFLIATLLSNVAMYANEPANTRRKPIQKAEKACPTIVVGINNVSPTGFSVNPTGGVAPYTYSIDGFNYLLSNTFFTFPGSTNNVYVKDANGCTGQTTFQYGYVGSCDSSFYSGYGSFFGGYSTYVVRNVGAVSGVVAITYNMYNGPSKMEVYYADSLVATTTNYVYNYGYLSFNYKPKTNGPNYIVVKVSSTTNTNWQFNTNCPSNNATSLTDGNLTGCAFNLVSPNYPGNYAPNTTYTQTLTPLYFGAKLKSVIQSLYINSGETFSIYDGDNTTSAPLLKTYYNYVNGAEIDSVIATNAKGQLTFKFTTVSFSPALGFRAAVYCSGNYIVTNSLSKQEYCMGEIGKVSYQAFGSYNNGNNFIVQLSDSTGSFSNPSSIGIITQRFSDSINVTYPVGQTPSTKYRVRVISTSPAATGGDNGTDISLVNNTIVPSVSITLSKGNNPGCMGDTSTLVFVANPINGGNNPEIEWRKNGVVIGTGAYFSSNTFIDGDTIQAFLTSNSTCASTNNAISNNIVIVRSAGAVAPTVTITASPSGKIDYGTLVTFTASNTSGGGNPVYQWYYNGVAVGTNSNTFSIDTLHNSDVIYCKLTSSLVCASPKVATSNSITAKVTPVYCIPPASCSVVYITNVSLNTLNRNSYCDSSGYSYFSSAPNTTSLKKGNTYLLAINTGTSYIQGAAAWIDYNQNGTYEPNEKLIDSLKYTYGTYYASVVIPNGVLSGETRLRVRSAYYASLGTNTCNSVNYGETEDYLVTIVDTGCVQPTLNLLPSYTGCNSVSVTASGAVNYVWSGGSSPNTAANTFTTTGFYTLTATGSNGCSVQTAVNVTVNPAIITDISIYTNDTVICKGTSVSFYTSSVSNGGATPSYLWKVNGVSKSTIANFTSSTLNNKDTVNCYLTSSLLCALPSVSNTIKMNVITSIVSPKVTITASPIGVITSGTPVTFTATVVNAGTTVAYQWFKNGAVVFGNNYYIYYDAYLKDGDVVYCRITSSLACVSPKTVQSNSNIASVIRGYCLPTSYCYYNDYISRVQFNTIDRASNCDNPTNGGYTFFGSAPNTTNLIRGNTYRLTVETSTLSAEGISAWIDFNKNGVFDTSELVMNGYKATQGAVYDTLIDIPDTLSTGYTLLRIMSGRYSNPGNNPCNSGFYGETEDYYITIQKSSCTQPTVAFTGNYVGCVSDTLSVSGGVTYLWSGGLYPNAASNVFTSSGNYLVKVTNSLGCSVTKGASILVNTVVTPTITAYTSTSSSVCAGTSINFYTNYSNAGISPTFQWFRNGAPIANATNYTLSINTLKNKDTVTCQITNTSGCKNVSVVSNSIVVGIYTSTTPASVSISAYPVGAILSGSAVTFTATPFNGGSFPTYQWKKNGVNVGSGGITYIDNGLNDGDKITCVITSNSTCVSVKVATSNTITLTVKPFDGEQQFPTFAAANLVVGQADFTSNVSAQTNVNTHGPSYSAISAKGVLAVVDQTGYRVLLWNNFTTNGQAADIVVGKPDFTSAASGAPTQSNISYANGVAFSPDGNKLLVCDYPNNRVLIWNTIPTSNGQPADLVLGQTDFITGTGGLSKSSLNGPLGIFVSSDGKLFVADQNNNRILIWNSIPNSNNTLADVVVGQSNFTTGTTGLSSSSFYNPWGVWVSPSGKLLIADTKNNRVLVFNKVPTVNGAIADVVIGQPDFVSNGFSINASSLSGPVGVTVAPDGKVAIGEYDNNRVLIFDSIPTTNGAAASAVLGQPDFTSAYNFYPTGSPTNQNMYHPYNVSYDLYGRLYVTGRDMNRVMVFGLKPTISTDLSIDINGTTTAVCNGSDVSFTVSITNNGGFTAKNVIATASIPATFVFNSASQTSGKYNPVSGYWNIDSIQPGKSVSLSLVGAVSSTSVSSIQAYANILRSNQFDSTLSNNATSTTININVGTPPTGGVLNGPSVIKTGKTGSFTIDSVSGATNYIWNISNATSYNTNGNKLTIVAGNPNDTIIIQVTPINASCSGQTIVTKVFVGCLDSTSSVTINAITPLYFGDSIRLTATAISNATYSWSGPNGFSSNNQNPIISNSTSLNTGVYSLAVSVNGCSNANATIAIVVKDSLIIAGNCRNSKGEAIKGVSVLLNNSPLITSNTNGTYGNIVSSKLGTYNIKLSKNNDSVKNNGVTVIDAILVQSHILNKTLLNSPYKIVAADVNNSGDVSTIDILYIKRLALGIDTTFKGNRLWAFVDSAYKFPDSSNPFPYKDSIIYTKISGSKLKESFVGLKLGDVNWDWDATLLGTNLKKNKPVDLYYNDVTVGNETEIRVPIRVKGFSNLLGMQFTLNYNQHALQLKRIEQNVLNLDYGINQAQNGKISFLWNDEKLIPKTLNDSSILIELVFTKLTDIQQENIFLSNDIATIEAWDGNYQKHNIIKTSGVIASKAADLITKETWEVVPNPTDGIVKVQFSLETAKNIQLQLTSIDGKILMQQKVAALKGNSSYIINLQSQNKLAKGIYYLKASGIKGNELKVITVE